MKNNLTSIKEILESEANLLVNLDDVKKLSKRDNNIIKKVVDNRFELVKKSIDSIDDKSDMFYAKLIQIISTYINQLYDRKIDFCNVKINSSSFSKELDSLDTKYFNSKDSVILAKANRELSKQLFDYICYILENNKDIKLDIETLKCLLNRNSKLFTLSVEKSYLYRPFDYKKFAKIINKNETIEKSKISLDEIYQLLLDTYQIDNDSVFSELVKPEQFNQNHKKVDEILTWCNAETFVKVTNIIRHYFDKNFDRLSIVKKRNNNKFCEKLIIELLHWYTDKEDYDLIHQILVDSEIEIDYDFCFTDYVGETNLKSIIALSGNKTIINDLLSKEENIQNCYGHGNNFVRLYTLYAIVGNYEKALINFRENYNFKYDLDDEDENWDRFGFAYGSWGYKDSFVEFISSMCTSFKENSIDYPIIVNLISSAINSENVKFINLSETLIPIQEVLAPDDFKLLIDALVEKYNSGKLGFLNVTEHMSMFTRYKIDIANKDEIQKQLDSFNKNKSLIHIK